MLSLLYLNETQPFTDDHFYPLGHPILKIWSYNKNNIIKSYNINKNPMGILKTPGDFPHIIKWEFLPRKKIRKNFMFAFSRQSLLKIIHIVEKISTAQFKHLIFFMGIFPIISTCEKLP